MWGRPQFSICLSHWDGLNSLKILVKIVPVFLKLLRKWHSQLFFWWLLLFCHDFWTIFFFSVEANSAFRFLLPEAAEERPQPSWLILEGQLVSTNTSFMAPVPPAVQFTCSCDSWWLWRQSPRTSPEQQFSWATVSMCLQVKIKSKLPASWNTCRSLKTQWIWYAWKHG